MVLPHFHEKWLETKTIDGNSVKYPEGLTINNQIIFNSHILLSQIVNNIKYILPWKTI